VLSATFDGRAATDPAQRRPSTPLPGRPAGVCPDCHQRHILSSRGVFYVTDQLTEPLRGGRTEGDEMSVMLLHQKVKDGSVEQAEAAVRDLFATLDRVRPDGIRYASTRVADSSTFVILFELGDGSEDPRPAIPEYGRFLEQLKDWVDGPPVIEHLDVVGSYNLFGAQREESAVR
jgi:hypothetical protein